MPVCLFVYLFPSGPSTASRRCGTALCTTPSSSTESLLMERRSTWPCLHIWRSVTALIVLFVFSTIVHSAEHNVLLLTLVKVFHHLHCGISSTWRRVTDCQCFGCCHPNGLNTETVVTDFKQQLLLYINIVFVMSVWNMVVYVINTKLHFGT